MPYTPEQIATLKATDPAIVKAALEKMDDSQRGELMAAIKGSAQPSQEPIQEPSYLQMAVQAIGNTPLGGGGLPGLHSQIRVVHGQNSAEGLPTVGTVGMGLANTVAAPAQFASHLVGSGAMDPAINAMDRFRQNNLQKSTTGEALGAAIPFLATAGGSAAPAAAKALSASERVKAALLTTGKATLTGGVAAPVLTPEVGVTSNSDFWGRKPGEAAVGAALGGGIGAATEAVSWLGSKAINALAGTKLGKMLGITLEVKPQYRGGPGNPGALERSAELDQAGIPSHTVGDVTGDRSIRKMEDAIGRNNPEMDAFRQKTINETAAYGDEVLNRLTTAMKQEGWSNLSEVQAAAKGGKRAKEAQTILEAVKNSGDDWQQIAKTDGGMELLGRKLKADAKYDKATALAEPLGAVDATSYKANLQNAIDTIEGNKANDQSLMPYLRGLLEDAEAGKNLNFSQMRDTRSILNRKMSSLTNPNTPVQDADAGRRVLGNVIGGLETDLDRFANSKSPALKAAWADASNYYRDAVAPYKELGIAKALSDQDPIKLVNLLNGKNEYAQQRTLDMMGEKGRAAVRTGIIDQALTAGGKTQKGVMGLELSPMSAAADLERSIKNGIGRLAFGGKDDIWTAQGMARVLRTVDRIGNLSGASTTTGATAQEIGAAVRGDVTALGAIERLHAWVSRDNLMRLYTDPKGRALLQAASSMKLGSPALANLVEKDIPGVLGVTSAKASPFSSAYQVNMPATASTGNPNQIAQK